VKQVRDLTKSEIEASIEHLNEIVDKLGDGSLRKRVILITVDDIDDESYKLAVSSFNMNPDGVINALAQALDMISDRAAQIVHDAPGGLQ
jgi:hypothetical protein